MNSPVLNSWKEIAAYLGRGRRTVQRWERELGLPVRRPHGHDRSAVIAFPEELDQWLTRAPARGNGGLDEDHSRDASLNKELVDQICRRADLLQRNTEALQQRAVRLMDSVKQGRLRARSLAAMNENVKEIRAAAAGLDTVTRNDIPVERKPAK